MGLGYSSGLQPFPTKNKNTSTSTVGCIALFIRSVQFGVLHRFSTHRRGAYPARASRFQPHQDRRRVHLPRRPHAYTSYYYFGKLDNTRNTKTIIQNALACIYVYTNSQIGPARRTPERRRTTHHQSKKRATKQEQTTTQQSTSPTNASHAVCTSQRV